jgi:hypothetical protein
LLLLALGLNHQVQLLYWLKFGRLEVAAVLDVKAALFAMAVLRAVAAHTNSIYSKPQTLRLQ